MDSVENDTLITKSKWVQIYQFFDSRIQPYDDGTRILNGSGAS